MGKFSELDIEQQSESFKRLRRRIEDYLRKYATEEQLKQIASHLNIK